MASVDLANVEYLGLDLLEDAIAVNRRRHPGARFDVLDITREVPPTADLVFCKDLFQHLTNAEIELALENLRKSAPRYLVTSSDCFPPPSSNLKRPTQGHISAPVNLEAEPFDRAGHVATVAMDSKYYTVWAMEGLKDTRNVRSAVGRSAMAVRNMLSTDYQEPDVCWPGPITPNWDVVTTHDRLALLMPRQTGVVEPFYPMMVDATQLAFLGALRHGTSLQDAIECDDSNLIRNLSGLPHKWLDVNTFTRVIDGLIAARLIYKEGEDVALQSNVTLDTARAHIEDRQSGLTVPLRPYHSYILSGLLSGASLSQAIVEGSRRHLGQIRQDFLYFGKLCASLGLIVIGDGETLRDGRSTEFLDQIGQVLTSRVGEDPLGLVSLFFHAVRENGSFAMRRRVLDPALRNTVMRSLALSHADENGATSVDRSFMALLRSTHDSSEPSDG